MRHFLILNVVLATIVVVAGEPQLFSLSLGDPSGMDGVGYGSLAPASSQRYRVKSPAVASYLSGRPGSINYEGASGSPESEYESSDADYQREPPSGYKSNSLSAFQSEAPEGYQSGSSEGGYESEAPEGYQSGAPGGDYQSEGLEGYQSGSLGGGYQSLSPALSSGYQSGLSGGGFQSSSPALSSGYKSGLLGGGYRSASPSLSGGYQSGPPPGYGRKPRGPSYSSSSGPPGGVYESSPPSYSFGGSPGYQRSPSESLPVRIGRGLMGLLASATNVQITPNFFSPPQRPSGPVFASSKSTTFYLEPPKKDAPSFFGVRSPFKFGNRNKSPISLLTSESNNQLQQEYVLSSSPHQGRQPQSVHQIVAQAAQAQHSKAIQKEQRAHPTGKITYSQINVPGGQGGLSNIPPQFQGQAYLNPYTALASGQPSGILSQQLVMATGPDGNPIFLQASPQGPVSLQFAPQQYSIGGSQQEGPQYTIAGPPPQQTAQYTLASPAQQQVQYTLAGPASQQAQYTLASPPQQQPQYTIATQQPQPQQFTLSSPNQQQNQGQVTIQYISAPGSNKQQQQQQGALRLASRPDMPFPSLTNQPTQLIEQVQGGGISSFTSPQYVSQAGLSGTGFTVTGAQSLYSGQPIPSQAQQDIQFQQLLLNQLGQSQSQAPKQQQQQQQQAQQGLTQGQFQNLIQQAISENIESQPQQQRSSEQQRSVKPSNPQGTSGNPVQFGQQDVVGAFSSVSEQVVKPEPEKPKAA